MSISEAVKAYLERGGVISRVPGFERVAPLPGRRVKETPAPALDLAVDMAAAIENEDDYSWV